MPNLDPFTTCQVAIRAASHLHVRNREWIAAARGVEPFVLAYMDDPDRPHLVEPEPEPELVITMPAVPIPHPGDVKRTEIAFMRYVLLAIGLAAVCGLCGCGGGGGSGGALPSAPTTSVTSHRVALVAVVGDSISKTVILPDSPVPCGAGSCDYSHDPSLAYPAVVASLTGAQVVNLAVPGSETTVAASPTIPAMTASQVPQVPANADVVIFEGGTNDVAFGGGAADVPNRIDVIVAAIRAQAPKARLVFVNVRDFGSQADCCGDRVAAWDAHLASVAVQVGATVVDLRPMWPAGVSADWPDGTHPGPNAVQKIGQAVAAAL